MRRSFALAALLLILVAAAAPALAGGKVYGKGVSSQETMAISELLASPEEHLGKTVRVSGPVVGLCKHRGCWIELASDQEYQKLMIKVNDGEIVFPPELLGETVIAEGKVEAIPMTHAQACAYLEKEATCQGQEFDKDEVPAEGITFYRIHGTGAVVVPPKAGAAAKTDQS